jgi:NhaP-type Na+/H+ and K+/H+ antiporter
MKRKYLILVILTSGIYLVSGLSVKVIKGIDSITLALIAHFLFSVSSFWLAIIYFKEKQSSTSLRILSIIIGLALILVSVVSLVTTLFTGLAKPW